MRTRRFRPPPTCAHCCQRPLLGESLLHTGEVWVCAQCLTDESPGIDTSSKIADRAMRADQNMAFSKRAKTAGDIEGALSLADESQWHKEAAMTMYSRGNHVARSIEIVNTEAVPRKPGHLKDTLADPDIAALESSEARSRLLESNGIVALGVDIANTVRAADTAEKLVAHEIALAHKIAMEQARLARYESDPVIELRRLQVSARMMAMAQQGVLTLQKLKIGGTQNVVVQHVHVESGGQAVVGNLQSGEKQKG